MDKLNERKNRLLLTAQVGLPENQFEAYRKILLDELGRNGFEKDLEEVLMQHMERLGTGRNPTENHHARCPIHAQQCLDAPEDTFHAV